MAINKLNSLNLSRSGALTSKPISPKDLNFDKKVQELMSYHQQTLEFEKRAAKHKIFDKGINFDSHMKKLLQAAGEGAFYKM